MAGWKSFILGCIVGVIGVAGAVFCYFSFGWAPVAANAEPMPFEKYLARTALRNASSQGAAQKPPIDSSAANLLAGAHIYVANCAFCHGLPGQGKTPAQQGMFPPPPQLLVGHGVTNDPPGRTYWVVRNGIRLTGMPGFVNHFPDEQLWQVTLFLAKAHELPAPVLDFLGNADSAQTARRGPPAVAAFTQSTRRPARPVLK